MTQTIIADNLHLVLAAADYDGLLLDVYCSLDEDGYELSVLTLHGDLRDLMPALSDGCIDMYTAWVELHTPSAAELRAQATQRARIDSYEWEREYRIRHHA